MKNLSQPFVDLDITDKSFKQDKYDEANAFLLLQKPVIDKKKEKVIKAESFQSKTKIKKLKKLQEQKSKRNKRIETLNLLKSSTLSNEEKSQMHSISYLQTHGKRKSFDAKSKIKQCNKEVVNNEYSDEETKPLNVSNLKERFEQDTLHPLKKQLLCLNEPIENNLISDELQNPPELDKVKKKDSCVIKVSKKQKLFDKATIEKDQLPKKVVQVSRDPSIQRMREKLPILSEEHSIMESINENPFVVICGETGSGKTTQVPQFLYEAGYAVDRRICVTEPRRVAATTLSQRVGLELGLGPDRVSYQIRHHGTVSPATQIKFVTDGVLMREVQNDFLLTDYSAIVIDEAHERSVFTDVLIGLLSRIIPVRAKRGAPLKLIIMSATMRIHDFTENKRLFKCHVPVIRIPSKQYPISIHFNLATPLDNYLEETFRKVCKIHRKLPAGGILVFMTGRAEVNELCEKLSNVFPPSLATNTQKAIPRSNKELSKRPDVGKGRSSTGLDSYPITATCPPTIVSDRDDDDLSSHCEEPLHLLPLYSLLAPERQALVFQYYNGREGEGQHPQTKARLCVVATNVAETSITIPGIKYVVDCGLEKRIVYSGTDKAIARLTVGWISKSSADQRAGRCGRTGPGHCYRLYSSAVYNDEFPKFTSPEIETRPVEDIVLQMKLLNIDKVENFPFPSPPPPAAIRRAELLLAMLGLMEPLKTAPSDANTKGIEYQYGNLKVTGSLYEYIARFNANGNVESDAPTFVLTQLGKGVASYPLNPRYGKMLSLVSSRLPSIDHKNASPSDLFTPDLLPYAVSIAAGISVRELFLGSDEALFGPDGNPSSGPTQELVIKKAWAGLPLDQPGGPSQTQKGRRETCSHLLGDLMVLLRAIGASDFVGAQNPNIKGKGQSLDAFCQRYRLRKKAIVEIKKLRRQLNSMLDPGSESFGKYGTGDQEQLMEQFEVEASSGETIDGGIMAPPNDQQLNMLRRLVLAGAGFNIAKRVDAQQQDPTNVENGSPRSKNLKKPYYQCLLDVYMNQLDIDSISTPSQQPSPVPAYIHPSSVLADLQPEYLVYQDSYLVTPKPTATPSCEQNVQKNVAKIYLRTVTDVDPKWLSLYYPSLCQYDVSSLATDDTLPVEGDDKAHSQAKYSSVYYDPKPGSVKCRAPCRFGPHCWDLPPMPIEYPYSLEKFKLFAKYFLEGKVFGVLQKYSSQLLLTPSTMLKSWAKLQSKTQSLLSALIKHDVDSRSALSRVWAVKNPNFLLKEYLEWLPQSVHGQVAPLWPLDKKKRTK